jgi:anti-anti-sigma factor
MKLGAKQIKNVSIISIEGDLDAQSGPEVDQFLNDQMAVNKNLVVDFSKVKFLSSAGLRVLLAAVKASRRQSGDLRLAATQENVKKVLTISGFTRIFKIYPDLDTAIKSYTE